MGATEISDLSRSIARTTALATCLGVPAPMGGGGGAPLSANIPASRIAPGEMTETPTPLPRKSSRRFSANPRRPNFVAAYMDDRGKETKPEREEMKTKS